MSDAPWYERFFGDNYLDVYGHQLSAEGAEHEASFVERALALKAGESLLDLCCGPGRHALLLAQRGLRVTALDLSQRYLDAAAAEAQRRGIEIETVRADMRAPGFDGRFDAVINMFSSFGYLESEAEDAKVLRGVAAALRPSGRALFDLINRAWVIRNQVANESRTGANEMVYLEHRELNLVTSPATYGTSAASWGMKARRTTDHEKSRPRPLTAVHVEDAEPQYRHVASGYQRQRQQASQRGNASSPRAAAAQNSRVGGHSVSG